MATGKDFARGQRLKVRTNVPEGNDTGILAGCVVAGRGKQKGGPEGPPVIALQNLLPSGLRTAGRRNNAIRAQIFDHLPVMVKRVRGRKRRHANAG